MARSCWCGIDVLRGALLFFLCISGDLTSKRTELLLAEIVAATANQPQGDQGAKQQDNSPTTNHDVEDEGGPRGEAGGTPDNPQEGEPGATPGNPRGENFVGHMQQLVFNGNHFFEMARTGRIDNIESTAQIQKRDKIVNQPITFSSPSAFLITRLKLYSTFSMYFQMRTTQLHGLILFTGNDRGNDFLALELSNGHLRYVYDVGSGPRVIRVHHPHPLNNNKWHDIAILRPTISEHIVRVDDTSASDILPDTRSVHFDMGHRFYLGGVPSEMYDQLPKQVRTKNGYQGCLASVDLNGERRNLLKNLEAGDETGPDAIIAGCHGEWMNDMW